MPGNDRTRTNGIIKNCEDGTDFFLVAGNNRTQTNGVIKNEMGAVKFFSGLKCQDSNQWVNKNERGQ